MWRKIGKGFLIFMTIEGRSIHFDIIHWIGNYSTFVSSLLEFPTAGKMKVF